MLTCFRPSPAGNIQIAVTTSSGATSLASPGGPNVLLTNEGPDTVFFAIGDSTITASVTTGMPLLVGASIVMDKCTATHIATICRPGKSAVLNATIGSAA